MLALFQPDLLWWQAERALMQLQLRRMARRTSTGNSPARMMQNAGTEVVEAKAGAGSATLSMAYAAYAFATECMKAMNGFAGVVECAYVEDDTVDGCDFFAQRVKLGKNGVAHKFGLGKLNESEQKALDAMKEQLAAEIKKGAEWSK